MSNWNNRMTGYLQDFKKSLDKSEEVRVAQNEALEIALRTLTAVREDKTLPKITRTAASVAFDEVTGILNKSGARDSDYVLEKVTDESE